MAYLENDEHNNVKQDWDTTCLIYDTENDALTGDPGDTTRQSLSICTDYQVLDTNSKDFLKFCVVHLNQINRLRWNQTPEIHVASIELPISASQTAIFAQPEAKNDTTLYRFWMLDKNFPDQLLPQHNIKTAQHRNHRKNSKRHPPQQKSILATQKPPSLRLKLMFLYGCDDSGPENDAYNDLADDMQGPSDVFVSLISPYPDSLPPDDHQPWMDWLQKRARTVLHEQQTSYAVCEFLDHHALDYFGGIQLEDEGYLLVLLRRSSSAMYWQAHNVDSLVFNPLSPRTEPREMILHHNKGTAKTKVSPAELWPKQRPHGSSTTEGEGDESLWWLHPCILRHERWFPQACPICFDEFVAVDMVTLDCNHLVCQDCFTMYTSVIVKDIYEHRHENPFKCPVEDCRQGIKIMAIVKNHLTPSEMDRVRAWYKDMNQPVSKLLPVCLDCPNDTGTMRKTAIDSFCVVCETCQKRRCEYCLEKIKDDSQEHLATNCKGAQMLKFARRYFRATPELQQKCVTKYPWMKAYAQARVESALAIREWLSKKEGQVCPTCNNGVVRTEGCFHIHCSCGAHFCYECGAELFPPFYGTHHCWENK